MMRRIWDSIQGFARFWYEFIIGEDWMAAAGVVVMIAAADALIQIDAPAFWIGPKAILTTPAVTIRRALHRPPDES